MVAMNKNAKDIERQAVVCIRMGHSMEQVARVAKARRWYGVLRTKLENEYLHLKAKQVTSL